MEGALLAFAINFGVAWDLLFDYKIDWPFFSYLGGSERYEVGVQWWLGRAEYRGMLIYVILFHLFQLLGLN